ncbi:Gldg family protein [Mangrovitalea sediminis]|uniref:Gldg family protein n=1 Tax=Mangrovitalea sediminis TaxID=1982043 RepID=UPI000BE4BE6E|nr:Gldg family protein [Mangrovitalea sediminis]
MPREQSIRRIARKEIGLFFSSPIAFVFLATFLAVVLFVFFWVDTFFARNIADVHPLFQWMPLLLIFLVAAITMRMWSEERRSGTIEFLMTLPVTPLEFVLGKFLACFSLLGIALLLTLPLPITVSMIGNLDWGPVIGAYVATLFLGAAYISIGLYVSARNDSQIVSLILTVLICLAFYLIGSSTLTDLVGYKVGDFLKLLGTGSRFDSITRGVIDIRDLYYYLSIMGVFLTLNILALERQRWTTDRRKPRHRLWFAASTLLILNFIAANVWLSHVNGLRIDMTRHHLYSLSPTTKRYLSELQEPLLIHAYFSSKTHPLLEPLIPELENLLKEYQVAGNGKVRLQIVDPQSNPDAEEAARKKFGIHPVPFEVSNKYQSSVVNSYFNIVVQYGDQYQVLGFRDLIDVKESGPDHLDVRLRNPEYDITRAIKKVLYGFQSSGDLFASLHQPVNFTGYISSDKVLPDKLATLKSDLTDVLNELKKQGGDKFSFDFKDPDAGDGSLAKQLQKQYGMQPMATSLLSQNTFYFYMMLNNGKQHVQVAIPDALDKAGLKHNIEAGLKRFASGFTKTVALYTPPPVGNPYMQQQGPSFRLLRKKLSEDMTVESTTLESGQVPSDADLLMVVDPSSLNKKQLFAIDQFLMQGGTVVLGTSPYSAHLTRTALDAQPQTSGLGDWLKHNGLSIDHTLALDPHNARFPIPIERKVGNFSFREIRLLDYPYFPDIRGSGLNQQNPITSGLPQVTMSWVSPIEVNAKANAKRKVTDLLKTSPQSWVSGSLDVTPSVDQGGGSGFQPQGKRASRLVGVMVQGQFSSYFKGKESPLLAAAEKADQKSKGKNGKSDADQKDVVSSVIDKSPDSARIILFPSNEFLSDQTLNILSSVNRSVYLNSLQLVQNAVDWSLEDRGLLAIRSRGHFANTLPPMSQGDQEFWEYLNYGLIVLGLLIVWGVSRAVRRQRLHHYATTMQLGRV